MKRRILSALMSLLCLFSLTTVSQAAQVYTDIPSSHWARQAVSTMSDRGIVKGYTDGSFRPNSTVTYGEFIKMAVVETLGADTVGNTSTPGHSWAEGYYNFGLFLGLYRSGDISPSQLDRGIPRSDMALIVAHSMEQKPDGKAFSERERNAVYDHFYDLNSYSQNADSIAAACHYGILNGYENGTFRPYGTLTRAESAMVIYRLMDASARVVTDFGLTDEEQPPETDDPGIDDPGTDNPGIDNPGTDNPGTNNPGDNGNRSTPKTYQLTSSALDCDGLTVRSIGHYTNWSGVSNVTQFRDQNDRFCFAVMDGNTVTISRTADGQVVNSLDLTLPSGSLLGTVVCDDNGCLYVVWGRENPTENTNVPTLFVYKYTSGGTLVATVQSCGDEGMPSYYGERFYTKIPFDGGNCDAALSGKLLAVNYAREMYSGHQSNGLLVLDTDSMAAKDGFYFYNSHSFDQRVSPYEKTGGFLLESQGDCFARGFTTGVTSDTKTIKEAFNGFDFWVEANAYTDYDMYKLNRTYARLGNVLETSEGAALVGISARSLSSAAMTEPYDLFVQVFDPTGAADSARSYVTYGQRSGYAGNNGDTYVTNYGVAWLTNFSGTGRTANKVQAVLTEADTIVVLYEVYANNLFDESRYLLLDADGTVLKSASLGGVRLNEDEDPVYADGVVQWIANDGDDTLVLYSLDI